MVKNRTRAAGGGRKPKGPISGKTRVFTTRITAETREAIEREAAAAGYSISQAAEKLLMLGVSAKKERERDPALRALGFLIGEIAHQVVGVHLTDGKQKEIDAYDWRSDPFFFRAFKVAVAYLLNALEPRGPIEPPQLDYPKFSESDDGIRAFIQRWHSSFKTPEARAEYAAEYILKSLDSIPRWTTEERDQHRELLNHMALPSAFREFYGMPDAARDLEIQPLIRGNVKVPMVFQLHKRRGK